jgi:hypothetical protein
MFNPGPVLDKLCGFIPHGAINDALQADISRLATEFCTLMGESYAQLDRTLCSAVRMGPL